MSKAKKERSGTLMSTSLGRRLFQARLSLSSQMGYTVSQTAVGKALGTTGTSIGRYEAGLKEPNLEMVERLAMVLRVTPCYLAFGCSHLHNVEDVSEPTERRPKRLPAHRPTRRELEHEGEGALPVPPPRLTRPVGEAGARQQPAARTSKAQSHTAKRRSK